MLWHILEDTAKLLFVPNILCRLTKKLSKHKHSSLFSASWLKCETLKLTLSHHHWQRKNEVYCFLLLMLWHILEDTAKLLFVPNVLCWLTKNFPGTNTLAYFPHRDWNVKHWNLGGTGQRHFQRRQELRQQNRLRQRPWNKKWKNF